MFGHRILKGKHKKLVLYVLAISLMISATSCASGKKKSTSNMHTDEKGNVIFESDRGKDIIANSIPVQLQYNDKYVTLTQVLLYENHVGYSYNLFIVAVVNADDLDESDLHWFEEEDIDAFATITCSQNGYDHDMAREVGRLAFRGSNDYVFAFVSPFYKDNRHDFGGSEVKVTITLTQDDYYDYTNSEGLTSKLNKQNMLTYSVQAKNNLPDVSTTNELLYEYIDTQLETLGHDILE